MKEVWLEMFIFSTMKTVMIKVGFVDDSDKKGGIWLFILITMKKVGFVLLAASRCEQCFGQPTTLQVLDDHDDYLHDNDEDAGDDDHKYNLHDNWW